MLVLYDSLTGNVKRFAGKLPFKCVKIERFMVVEEPFVLITYTTGMGQSPKKVMEFLEDNHKYMVGVSASGSLNWGYSYAKSADIISEMYNVPILSKFEMSGNKSDILKFIERVRELDGQEYTIEQ